MSKNHTDVEWYKRHLEKALSAVAVGTKNMNESTLKKMRRVQESSHKLINEYVDLKVEQENLKRTKIIEEALLSNLGEGMLVIDSSCKLIFINKRAREMLGISSKDRILGENYFEHIVFCMSDRMIIPWRQDPIYSAFASNTKKRLTLADDVYCKRIDDSIFPITASISPFSVDDTSFAVAVTIYDASQEKQTADIKSDFVSVASHQLKTPLTISTMHTELLLREYNKDTYSENFDEEKHLKEILFGNKKIEELLNKFFIISKISSGKISVQRKEHYINEIIDDILHELSFEMQEKKIILTKNYEDSIIGCVDLVLLRIAIHNIISNAIKYNKDGGSIDITTSCSNGKICISVKDSGRGIPDDEKQNVFMEFYRGAKKKGKPSGSGVGLYITKSIIEQSGGEIWFDSEVDNGSIFHISFPTLCDVK